MAAQGQVRSVNPSRADQIIAEINEDRAGSLHKRHWLVISLLTVTGVAFVAMFAALGFVVYQIYSCTDPDGACRQEGDQRTGEVIAELNHQHDALEQKLDDLEELLRRSDEQTQR